MVAGTVLQFDTYITELKYETRICRNLSLLNIVKLVYPCDSDSDSSDIGDSSDPVLVAGGTMKLGKMVAGTFS